MPQRIYSNRGATNKGGEYYLDYEGRFMETFSNLIFKKNEINGIMAPEFNEIKIDVSEDSLMTLLFQYEMHNMNEILLEVTDLMNFDSKVTPIDHHVNE